MEQKLMQLEKLEVPKLPIQFVEYVNQKLAKNKKGGRPHLVKQLGNLNKVLEILKEVWLERKTIGKVARKHKVSYHSIWRFINECKLYQDQILHYLKYVEKVKPKDFEAFESVRKWKDMIRLSGHTSAFAYLSTMQNLLSGEYYCSFKCNPDKFNLEKAQELVLTYLKETGKTEMPQHLRLPIRHFLASKGECPPRGFGSQYGLSGENNPPKYDHIKLTDQQLETANSILMNDPIARNNGYHIAFRIGYETCPRSFALSTIPISRIRKEGNLCIVEQFESKVKRGEEFLGKKGMWWEKYVSPQTFQLIQDFIEKHLDRIFLFGENDNATSCREWLVGERWSKHGKPQYGTEEKPGFRNWLKKLYKQLGLKDLYFYEHSGHALRHIGAHYLLEKTSYKKDGIKLYNYELVAKLGGWLTPRILREYYASMPKSIVIGVVQKMYGN